MRKEKTSEADTGNRSVFMDCWYNGVSNWHLDQPEENWDDFFIKNVRKRNYEYEHLLMLYWDHTVNLWQKKKFPRFSRENFPFHGMSISEKLLATIQFIIFQIMINAVLLCCPQTSVRTQILYVRVLKKSFICGGIKIQY